MEILELLAIELHILILLIYGVIGVSIMKAKGYDLIKWEEQINKLSN